MRRKKREREKELNTNPQRKNKLNRKGYSVSGKHNGIWDPSRVKILGQNPLAETHYRGVRHVADSNLIL